MEKRTRNDDAATTTAPQHRTKRVCDEYIGNAEYRIACAELERELELLTGEIHELRDLRRISHRDTLADVALHEECTLRTLHGQTVEIRSLLKTLSRDDDDGGGEVPKAAPGIANDFVGFAKEIVVALKSATVPREEGPFFLAPARSVIGATKNALALYTVVDLVWQIAAVDAETEAVVNACAAMTDEEKFRVLCDDDCV